MVPIWSSPMLMPAPSHQFLNSVRPLASSSVSVCRLLPPATPGPISASAWIESHSRSGLIRRFSPCAAIGALFLAREAEFGAALDAGGPAGGDGLEAGIEVHAF